MKKIHLLEGRLPHTLKTKHEHNYGNNIDIWSETSSTETTEIKIFC